MKRSQRPSTWKKQTGQPSNWKPYQPKGVQFIDYERQRGRRDKRNGLKYDIDIKWGRPVYRYESGKRLKKTWRWWE